MSKPLPRQHGDRYIRLLNLAANAYSLSVHRLDEAPPFHALSYCWGTKAATESIICDGKALSVTPNLYVALTHLRELEYKVLWIDAICINQADLAEKNHQVSLMGQIYRSALQTVVWLGAAGPDHDHVVKYIRLLSDTFQQHGDHIRASLAGSYLPQSELPKVGLPAWQQHQEPLLQSLGDFFALPWFSRAWCIQEFALADDVVFINGTTVFDVEDLPRALAILQVIQGFRSYMTRRHNRCLELARTRLEVQSGNMDKLQILDYHRMSLCKDERDHVFSMLGIFEKLAERTGTKLDITPDYGAALSDVYQAVAIEVLLELNDFDVLHHLRFSDRPSPVLPSWVPDFGTTTQVLIERHTIREQDWNASKSTSCHYKIENNLFHVSAQSFDTIVAVSKHIPNVHDLVAHNNDKHKIIDATKGIAAVLTSRQQVCPRSGQYVTGQTAQDAYWQTYFFLKTNAISMDEKRKHELQSGEESMCDMNFDDREGLEYSTKGRHMGRIARSWRLEWSMIMARTYRGYYCWVPYLSRVGDEIALLPGGKLPFAIRHVGTLDTPSYHVLGGCYVHGIMFGEGWDPSQLRDIWFE